MPGDYVPVTMQAVIGTVEEKFNAALGRVLTDIANPAAPAEAVREINIKIKLQPDATRMNVKLDASVDTKLARSKPSTSFMLVAMTEDGPVGRVSTAQQRTLLDEVQAKADENAGGA